MTTVALTEEQYHTLVTDIRDGNDGHRPNTRIAMTLVLEANMGMRISDILAMRFGDIVRDGSRWRLNVVEQKTGKARRFTVPAEEYEYIRAYCLENNIKPMDPMFPLTSRAVEKRLTAAAADRGYENIGTHSFRKYFATRVYVASGYNIVLVQTLLQHASASTTQRYIGIGSAELEAAIQNSLDLI